MSQWNIELVLIIKMLIEFVCIIDTCYVHVQNSHRPIKPHNMATYTVPDQLWREGERERERDTLMNTISVTCTGWEGLTNH